MSNQTALVFGSNGLIGSALLEMLLQSDDFTHIIIFVRKLLPLSHHKLQQVVTDFDHLETIQDKIQGSHVFICLGTTMAKAGSKQAFYMVDYTYILSAARLASANGVNQLLLVSSLGADASSSIFYSKVKGELERDILTLPFQGTHIFRPSLLLGSRKENRIGEKIAQWFSKYLKFLLVGPLHKYRPIEAKTVAKAMIKEACSGKKGHHIYESNQIEIISNL